jgi:tetrapyrrole methylase family protein/MazG family protein
VNAPAQLDKLLAALPPGALDRLSLCSSASLRRAHVPPFPADAPALITGLNAPDDFSTLHSVLSTVYPREHELTTLSTSGVASTHVAVSGLASLGPQPQDSAIYVPPLTPGSSSEALQEVVAHLRAPEGCPWDRKQTHQSLRPYLLEEAYEVLDALDTGDLDALREELGDLLLQIVLHSQIAVGEGTFRMADVIAGIIEKIIRRHPHVWGDVNVENDQDVKVNWDRLKQAEKQANDRPKSRLDGVPKALPALSLAYSYQDRAARVKFDWDTIEPVIAKLHEEIGEMLAAEDDDSRAKEVGDLLFAAANVARWLGVDPESALRGSNARFYRRFKYIEQQATIQGRGLDEMSLAEMDALWDEAKANGL